MSGFWHLGFPLAVAVICQYVLGLCSDVTPLVPSGAQFIRSANVISATRGTIIIYSWCIDEYAHSMERGLCNQLTVPFTVTGASHRYTDAYTPLDMGLYVRPSHPASRQSFTWFRAPKM